MGVKTVFLPSSETQAERPAPWPQSCGGSAARMSAWGPLAETTARSSVQRLQWAALPRRWRMVAMSLMWSSERAEKRAGWASRAASMSAARASTGLAALAL